MLPILNNSGLPLCLSGISHSLAFQKEKADHDRRREAMKKMRFEETFHGNEEVLKEEGFSCISLSCTAKAA
ncbi:hypothetical protein PHJA_000243400 [Phtheirospermum japonicum]|uniref:Uncharacterized protein n=1 Tax=Phtheirospermum japonicum TaxID=374723 RepID=A0A830BG34_9LAMI|nr:hypothetical protein PHJA_000243400 [Phtheirospermum japonicum]